MKYELYHDESLEGGYWHGMLLVPEDLKGRLASSLREVRQHLGYADSIGIKKVKKPGIIYDCADSWMQIGVASLRSRTKGMPYPIYLGKRDKGTKEYAFFDDKCFGTKFILVGMANYWQQCRAPRLVHANAPILTAGVLKRASVLGSQAFHLDGGSDP